MAQDIDALEPEPLKISAAGSTDKGNRASVCSVKDFLRGSDPCHPCPLKVPTSPLDAKAKKPRYKKSIKDIGRLFSTPKRSRIRSATVGGSPVSSYTTPSHPESQFQSHSLPVTPVRPRHRPLIVPMTTDVGQHGQSVEAFPPLVSSVSSGSSDSSELPRESSIRKRLNSIPRKLGSMVRKKS